jgi:hypothetical protein
MKRRPLTVVMVGWLFVVVGVGSLGRQLLSFGAGGPTFVSALPGDFWYVAVSAAAATVSGAFILRGASWARWLLGAWLAFHVALSFGHGPFKLAVHTALAAAVVWLLYRAPITESGGGRIVVTTDRGGSSIIAGEDSCPRK